jgi:hypothetical protein
MRARLGWVVSAAVFALALAACGDAKEPAAPAERGEPAATDTPELPSAALFRDVSATCGIDFAHAQGGVGNRELPETMGGGVALLDFDGDGDFDVFFSQSGALRAKAGEPDDLSSRADALFANDGSARFERVPDAAGAAGASYGQGSAVGDFDGDGRDDLLALNWGPNTLWRNAGGRFEDASRAAGISDEDAWSVSAAFFDAEGDGDLDLYVVNYLASPPGSYEDPRINPGAPGPFRAYAHPDRFYALPDRYYQNDGAGRLVEASEVSGLAVVPGKGLGVLATDVDLDGFPELYVANDSTPNFLFWNRGDGTFEERGPRSGTAFNDYGRTEAGMGVDAADVDGDLDLDLFVTNLDLETNTLYLNESGASASAMHRDRTNAAGLAEPSRLRVGFGALFLDADRDGDQDLVVVNGHVIDNVESVADNRLYAQPNQLYLNDGPARFRVAPDALVPGFERRTVSRGSALGDLDGDGAPDLVVGNNGGAPQVFLGTPPTGARWLALALEGAPGNRRGLGAKVTLELDDGRALLRTVEAARSYGSASEPAVFTGLPAPVRAVQILWPGGTRERWDALALPFEGRQSLTRGSGEPVGE